MLITKEDLAEMLDHREIHDEISDGIENILAANKDLVVVFGASDDLMIFKGAIDDEVDCFDGGKAYLTGKGLLQNACHEESCPYFKEIKNKAAVIEAIWAPPGWDISWVYKTDIPHATFSIMEDGKTYCLGIVFNLSGVKGGE
ncbi:MAG: hypothetical protein RBT11_19720 [Desulfobacterales bacterium]|jgi:hypothetical protein|nr:hypothetical protein [Desulfobacterales bacterium]